LVEAKVNRTALSFCLLDAYEPLIIIISKGRVVTVNITVTCLRILIGANGISDRGVATVEKHNVAEATDS
jgi:hypothetical protein